MSITQIINTVIATIQNFGIVPFVIAVVVDIILWRIHPVLGFLGVLFLFAIILGLI